MVNNSDKPNQENSQRRRANQPAVPPTACTTTTTAVPTVTVFIPPIHQASLQQPQQLMTHPAVYEDPTPIMNLQGDVDVDKIQHMDIEDHQVPRLTPPSRFDGKFGRPTAEKAVFTIPPRMILSSSAATSLAHQKYPTAFNHSTAAGSSLSAYQTAEAQCGTAARQGGGQASSCLRPVSQEVIAPCLADIDQQQQWQQQGGPTPFHPQAESSMSSSSTASNWPLLHLFVQTGLGFGTTEPAKGVSSPSAGSNGQYCHKPLRPSFCHFTYNNNTGSGNCSSLPYSSSFAISTPAPAVTAAPAFGQPSFPSSVTQISAPTPSRSLVPMPFGFTLKSPFLPRSAADFHYQQQQFQQQEYSQAINANTPSPSSFVNKSNDVTVTTVLSDAIRCPELSDVLQRTFRKRLDHIRKESSRKDRLRVRSVQKRRRRCMIDTDSGREETDYSDKYRYFQSLSRPFERRQRSSLPINGGQSRKDRRMSRREVKEVQYFMHLKAKCRKMLSELDLNERKHQSLIRTSAPMAAPPPSLPSASDIRANQEYRALHASVDYEKIDHDPEEMRKYQGLERVGRNFLQGKSGSELALLEEMAMDGMTSAESERTTVFDSGLTAEEWLEAQGWTRSPAVDPLMVFTMHTPDRTTGDNEESGAVADTSSEPTAASGNNTATSQSTEPLSQPAASTTNTTSTNTRTSSLWRLLESVAPPPTIASRSAATTTATALAETTTSTTTTSTTASPSTAPLRQSPSTNTNTGTTTSTQETLIDNERTNRNKALRGVSDARRQEEVILREEAQEAALKKARRKFMRAQVRREEEDELLAEEIREQEDRDRRKREGGAVPPLDPVVEEARRQWIVDQLKKQRIRDECLDDELQELLELERQRDEVERTMLMEQSRMQDEQEKRRETRRLQMKYDEDLANTRPSSRRKTPAASGSTPASASITTRTPALIRTISYVTGRDSTSTTNSMVLSVFGSPTAASSTTNSSPVPDSPGSALASGQESPSALPARLSEAEQKREDMNYLADRNVEDLARHARAAAQERSPSRSDESDTDSGEELQSMAKRRQIINKNDDSENDEYEQQQQQQDGKHKQQQQDDNSADEGPSSGRRRKTPQEPQLERDEAFARELQDREDSQRLSTQGEIDEDTEQKLQRLKGQRATAGVPRAGAETGNTMTLEEQRLESDMAMAKRMQQEENDNEPQSDSKPGSVVRRKLSLRIIAQKERLLSPTSESTTPAAPPSRPKKTATRTRSNPSAAKQKQQKPQKQHKPTRKLTRQLAVSSSASSTTPVQASSPSIQSAVEMFLPPFSLPSPMLSSTTHPRKITISSLLTNSSTPSPTGWDFPSSGRSSSPYPPRVRTNLYTPYKRSSSPQPSRTQSPPTQFTRSSSTRGQHSQQSSPPQAGTEHHIQSSGKSSQPEQSKEGLKLLADACERAASSASSSLSTLVSTPATEQIHQHRSTTSALAGESTTTTTTATNTTPTYASNQPSPHAEPGSSTATTVLATPTENGTRSPPEEAPPRTSRRSLRIQEQYLNENVSKHLAKEKARKEEEERKAKELKKKGRKSRAVKEENKEEDVKEATKKGHRPRPTKEEAKEEAEEVKPKGRKRKATEEANREDIVVKKGRKPKAAKEEERKEEATEGKKKGRRPKAAKEKETKEDASAVKKVRKPKTATEEKEMEVEEAKPMDRKRKVTDEAKEERNAEAKKIRKPRTSKRDTQGEDKAKDEKGNGKRAKK
ncbi:hypothetical protein EC957_007700 [Mortierella hygrophila]|uniref:Uncharacterized protein n=1 Tax=Mortierella hygrophila TaxID=979708 RepID=A0A9P6EWS1_9FUNG|nr:hypothetical protein EC957_007700 [Mortierella hygrophila]